MADRLARIFGTEEDKIHNKPVISQTVLMPHMYENPPAAVAFADGIQVPDHLLVEAINHFEGFYEEVFLELAKYGEVEELHICDNIGEHLLGNVYVKFIDEQDADKALKGLNGRYYGGKPIKIEFSPVTDFKESRCRLYVEGSCDRGGYCNFMHLKHTTKEFQMDMKYLMYQEFPEYRRNRERELEKKQKDTSRSKSKESTRVSQSKHKKRSRSRSLSIQLRDSKRKRKRSYSDSSRSKSRSSSRSSNDKSRKKKSKKSKKDKKDRKKGGDLRKESSAERRAIIAAWNQEDDYDDDKNESTSQSDDPRKSLDPRFKNNLKAKDAKSRDNLHIQGSLNQQEDQSLISMLKMLQSPDLILQPQLN